MKSKLMATCFIGVALVVAYLVWRPVHHPAPIVTARIVSSVGTTDAMVMRFTATVDATNWSDYDVTLATTNAAIPTMVTNFSLPPMRYLRIQRL